jgi:hypothetical protein
LSDAADFANALVLRGGICAAKGEAVPLVLLDDPSPFRDMVIDGAE